MLQHEDIAKVQEIKGKFNKVWLNSDYLRAHLNILGFNRIKKQFSWCKKAGFSFEDLIATLLILPLIGINSIYGLTTDKDPELNKCVKDSYYRTCQQAGLGKSKNQLESFFGPVCKAIFIER
jgi:hypothetical protein